MKLLDQEFLEPQIESQIHKGSVEVICGSMFSGKTEELLRRLKRAKFAKLSIKIFKPIIDTLEMSVKRDELPLIKDETIPVGFTFRSMNQEKDLEILSNIQNETFANHWGYSKNSKEDIASRLSLQDTGSEHVIFSVDENNNIVGYIWTSIIWRNDHTSGRILMTGIDKAHRGKKLGRATVNTGVKHLLSLGVLEIDLEVSSMNEPAISLYQSLGFQQIGKLKWYELDLGQTLENKKNY